MASATVPVAQSQREQCLLLQTRYDHNGALERERSANRIFLRTLGKNHDVMARGTGPIGPSIQQAGHPSLLVIDSHGNPNGLRFSRDIAYTNPRPDEYQNLAPRARIFILGCSTGLGIAERVAAAARRTVFAPTAPASPFRTFVFQNGTNPVCLFYDESGNLITRVFNGNHTPEELERIMFTHYEAGVRAGDPLAQFQLGKCYLYGFGVPKDASRGLALLKMSTNHLPEAASELGKYLYKSSPEEARAYLEMAAKADISDAQVFLAQTSSDFSERVYWYERAAANHSIDAYLQLGLLLKVPTKHQNLQKAFACLREAANRGSAKASYQMGISYLKGQGVEVNESYGVYYLEKAAIKTPTAYLVLGQHFLEKGDRAKAVKYLHLAAQKNVPYACFEFAKVCGNLTDKIFWLEKEDFKDESVYLALGKAYKEFGDVANAKANLEQAASMGEMEAMRELAELAPTIPEKRAILQDAADLGDNEARMQLALLNS